MTWNKQIKITSLAILLLFLVQKGMAYSVLNPYTGKPISTDSILDHVMTYSPFYQTIVDDFKAELYIKGKVHVKKRNFIIRYVPSMFRLQKGVRDYLLETSSDLHFTAPNIYDQKVKASLGTLKGRKSVPGLLEYFNVNIYSSSLLNDERLLSPLAANARKYYTFMLDSVMGPRGNLDYKIRFIPKTKSDQLVGGYMLVSSNVWSVREIRFSGRSELITFMCKIQMGAVGSKDEFLPVRYDLEARFNFLGNKIDGNYTALLKYKSIDLKEERVRKKEKKNYNLSESFSLSCAKGAYYTDSTAFAVLRPIPLDKNDKAIYRDYFLRKDTLQKKVRSRGSSFWGTMGDIFVEDYKINLSHVGSVRCSPFINPLLLNYGSTGLSYRQDFRYSRLFPGDKLLRIVPKIGYNFTHKEFYWALNADFEYWPQKRGGFDLSMGSGNRIYSSGVLDALKEMPNNTFDFDKFRLDYFRDLYINFNHRIEPINGLEVRLGFSSHKRTAVNSVKFEYIGNITSIPPPDFLTKLKKTYISVAPHVRLEFTPGQYYYLNGKRKMNLRSDYPTFSFDYERGLKGVFSSTGQYERLEVDVQHKIRLGLMRNIYYRLGAGAFTNQEELYFVDFANFSRNNLPVGWNDEIGGVFHLLDGRWYNSSRKYVRGHFTYEAPFLLIPHLIKYTRYVQNERLYLSVLSVPHLQPYLEIGYGIGTHVFDVGVFVSSENWNFNQIGCKFTFELFNR